MKFQRELKGRQYTKKVVNILLEYRWQVVAQACAGSGQTTFLALGPQIKCFMLKAVACEQERKKENIETRERKKEE